MSWDTKIKKESHLNINFYLCLLAFKHLFLKHCCVRVPFHFQPFCRLVFSFLFTVLLPFWCTVCHWLRLIMKIIYCVSGFPSLCYMTWGVRARINLFTVACSCFVSISSSVMQVWSKIMGFSKGKEITAMFWSFKCLCKSVHWKEYCI